MDGILSTMTQQTATPGQILERKLQDDAAMLMRQLSDRLHRAAAIRTAFENTPIGQQMVEMEREAEALRNQLKLLFRDVVLVVQTPFGKVGNQRKTTYAYDPGEVARLFPDQAQTLVKETVHSATLESLVKSLEKGGLVASGTLDDLRRTAIVEHGSTWTCTLTAK